MAPIIHNEEVVSQCSVAMVTANQKIVTVT